MTFSDALELMKKGKAVKRKISKNHIKLEGDMFNLYDNKNNIIFKDFEFNSYDLLDNGWEIYDERTLIDKIEKIIRDNNGVLFEDEKTTLRQAINELIKKENK